MRYKDEVKGSAELNWLNDLLESQTIEAITINRKTAELLLNYEQLNRTDLDETHGKQYVFDLMSLNHKLQIEHMKRR